MVVGFALPGVNKPIAQNYPPASCRNHAKYIGCHLFFKKTRFFQKTIYTKTWNSFAVAKSQQHNYMTAKNSLAAPINIMPNMFTLSSV
ncbi:MAG: hypothetical protein WCQ95_09405, partial [Bacteroidota bacterium]